MTTTPTVTIALVDDHNLFRKGLLELINLGDSENRYQLLFEAEDGTDLMTKMEEFPAPEIILMDVAMQDMDGFASVTWLKEHHPEVKILVVDPSSTEAILRVTTSESLGARCDAISGSSQTSKNFPQSCE